MSKVFFDIGANNGSWTRKVLNADPDATVYVVEPTPFLLDRYLNKLAAQYKHNVVLIPKAIDVAPGEVQFNIAQGFDWGCSSIHEFSDGLDKTWPGRKDFKVTDTHMVDCVTMKSIVEQYDIEQIDFMHCDVQGNDLNVLLSFEDRFDTVQHGEVEVFTKNPLYKNVNNSLDNVREFLAKRGYDEMHLVPNEKRRQEWNIGFSKQSIDTLEFPGFNWR